MSIRTAMITGPAPASRDGVSDYAERLAGALGGTGVEVTAVPVRPPAPGRWLAATVDTAETVRRLRPDVVHVQFAPSAYRFSALPGLLPRLLPPGTPVVTTVHEYGWWSAPDWLPGAVWRPLELLRLWDRETALLVPASHTVVVTNPEHGTRVRQRTGRRPTLIPLAPNVDPTGVPRADARRRLGVDEGDFLLVFFGFVHPVKGVRYLLEALPALRAIRPDVRLAVAGGFTSQALPEDEARAFRRELEALAARCGVADAVSFTGYLPAPEVSALLAAADGVVLPFTAGVSARSGALLAALAHGVPTAVTVPDEPDPRLRDGENVATIRGRRDAAAIAVALRRLIGDPALRERLAAGGRSLAAAHTWPAVARAHRDLYARVLADA
ncbi:glycosyltransferase [Phytohabitans kaempferiae]|uniref:Glycosyltransferase n=1 Tax=Phytohabitans kaempferiae TaxID=1620943 RepID=A0ABV6M2U4_9ACTN